MLGFYRWAILRAGSSRMATVADENCQTLPRCWSSLFLLFSSCLCFQLHFVLVLCFSWSLSFWATVAIYCYINAFWILEDYDCCFHDHRRPDHEPLLTKIDMPNPLESRRVWFLSSLSSWPRSRSHCCQGKGRRDLWIRTDPRSFSSSPKLITMHCVPPLITTSYLQIIARPLLWSEGLLKRNIHLNHHSIPVWCGHLASLMPYESVVEIGIQLLSWTWAKATSISRVHLTLHSTVQALEYIKYGRISGAIL